MTNRIYFRGLVVLLTLSCFGLSGCSYLFGQNKKQSDVLTTEQVLFWNNLKGLCGQSFVGAMEVGTEPSDAQFADAIMSMRVFSCSKDKVRIAFNVDDNRSRTWVITKNQANFDLYHRHLNIRGEVDPPSGYGGRTVHGGEVMRQEFKVNDETVAMLPATKYNVWAMELKPRDYFIYELRRKEQDRLFRVRFALDQPILSAPLPWGEIQFDAGKIAN